MPRSKMMRLVGIIHLLCNNDVGGEYLCIVDCQIIFTSQDCALPYCWPFLQENKSCGVTQIRKELSVSNCGLIFLFIVSKEQVEDRWEVFMLVKYLLLSIMFTLFLSTTQISMYGVGTWHIFIGWRTNYIMLNKFYIGTFGIVHLLGQTLITIYSYGCTLQFFYTFCSVHMFFIFSLLFPFLNNLNCNWLYFLVGYRLVNSWISINVLIWCKSYNVSTSQKHSNRGDDYWT